MADPDPINPFEAPKQLATGSELTINDPIRYEATPTIGDLKSALAPTSAIALACILLSIPLLIFIAILLRTFVVGPKGAEIVFGLGVLFFVWRAAFNLRSKIYAGETHLRLNPDATAPLTGELTNEGLRLESENRVSWQPHAGLTFCRTRNNQLSLCHDPSGQVVKVLPIRGFHNPSQALQFFEFQASKISQPLDMTAPLEGPIMVGDQPADAIAFDGIVKGKDLKTSPLEKLRLHRFNRSAIVLLLVNAILLPPVFMGFSWSVTIYVGVAVFLYNLLVINNILRSFFAYRDPEIPLIAIQGWLDERQITLLHNIGQSLLGWEDFRSVGVSDTCIWLEPYGGKNRFVLLPRHFFSSDTQWQTATSIAASHLTK